MQPNQATETWRSGHAPRRPRRRRLRGLISGLITAAILIGVLAYLLLRGQGGDLAVAGVKVQAPSRPQRCDSVVEITAALTTNGKAGRISYRWIRSDGPAVGPLAQSVKAGQKQVTVPPFSWTVKGEGRKRFTATLEVIEPKASAGKAADSFTYICR